MNDKVKGFFGGDPEEIVDEAGDVAGEAGDAAENVVDGVIETQSKLGEYKEIVTIFVVVLNLYLVYNLYSCWGRPYKVNKVNKGSNGIWSKCFI